MQTYCGAEGIIAGLRRCGATLNGISGAARIGRNVVVLLLLRDYGAALQHIILQELFCYITIFALQRCCPVAQYYMILRELRELREISVALYYHLGIAPQRHCRAILYDIAGIVVIAVNFCGLILESCYCAAEALRRNII